MLQLGVIADDFTGASDIASFLTENGLRTVQMNGIPARALPDGVDAVVISLKSRSIAAQEAIAQSLSALQWLQAAGCQQFFFKYCSTFDSTAAGNIGPVTDALLDALGEDFTVISPALPVNGRTIFNGYLFVGQVLLNESGMQNHPITPMRDASQPRLMDAQARDKTGLVAYPSGTVSPVCAQTATAMQSPTVLITRNWRCWPRPAAICAWSRVVRGWARIWRRCFPAARRATTPLCRKKARRWYFPARVR